LTEPRKNFKKVIKSWRKPINNLGEQQSLIKQVEENLKQSIRTNTSQVVVLGNPIQVVYLSKKIIRGPNDGSKPLPAAAALRSAMLLPL